LFRSRGFRAAAIATVFLGGALFGTLLVLPLYYQVARGQSALHAGLLLAPQGLGAALMLPISGRLTDRVGGGPVAVAGCSLAALATIPWVFVTDHTPYALLGVVLFVRGLGLGASIQPAVAAAYALLDSSQVPRATAALNTLRQVGGSIGTALLAVVLQHEATAVLPQAMGGAGGLLAPLSTAEREQISGPVASAFAHTFIWALAMALLAVVCAVALWRAGTLRAAREHVRRCSARRCRAGSAAGRRSLMLEWTRRLVVAIAPVAGLGAGDSHTPQFAWCSRSLNINHTSRLAISRSRW
jgi:MFS family permease